MASLEDRVSRAVRQIESHSEFRKWLADEQATSGDLIIINNSFVFREVETEKSPLYLAAEIGPSGRLQTPPSVVTLPTRQNLDFRRFASQQARPPLQQLLPAITQQKRALGQLVFGLIGIVSEDRRVEVTPPTGSIKRIVWNPSAAKLLVISGDAVEIKSVDDEEALWAAYRRAADAVGLTV